MQTGRAGPSIEEGDKIVLPSSSLRDLTARNIQYPMTFELRSVLRPDLRICCGVMEFTAPEGRCLLPKWILETLDLKNGESVSIKNVRLPKGTFVSFKPIDKSFLKLSNPLIVLEKKLRGYTCLTKNSVIVVTHLDIPYRLEIKSLSPADAVNIIETDLFMEFVQTGCSGAKRKHEEIDLSNKDFKEKLVFAKDSKNEKQKKNKILKDSSIRWSEVVGDFRYFYQEDAVTKQKRLLKREKVEKKYFQGQGHKL
ncbi:Ubiquitin recognition factor in ER-associated degradation protein 1 [Bonamia ostreae]|uniref:Ubiquitin recognition factor in ER-associated degradation protein 1 n=1 Tax=Bonamia ostreae TaxID=126728 RepID=A0ABV2AHX5_9EUKA